MVGDIGRADSISFAHVPITEGEWGILAGEHKKKECILKHTGDAMYQELHVTTQASTCTCIYKGGRVLTKANNTSYMYVSTCTCMTVPCIRGRGVVSTTQCILPVDRLPPYQVMDAV